MEFKVYIEEKDVEKENNIIEIGHNISDNFWQDFLLLLNNSKGMSDLLDVSVNKISTWNKKINQALKDYENKKNNNHLIKKKHKIIKTGINTHL